MVTEIQIVRLSAENIIEIIENRMEEESNLATEFRYETPDREKERFHVFQYWGLSKLLDEICYRDNELDEVIRARGGEQ